MPAKNAKSKTHEEQMADNRRLVLDLLGHLEGKEEAAAFERQLSKIIPAPEWLKKRMEAVRSQSHVTTEQALQQARASAEYRRKTGIEAYEKEVARCLQEDKPLPPWYDPKDWPPPL